MQPLEFASHDINTYGDKTISGKAAYLNILILSLRAPVTANAHPELQKCGEF